MSTFRQEKLADAIIENMKAPNPKTAGEVLKSVGYGEGTAEGGTSRIIDTDGVQEALAKRGFTAEKAKEVVAEIMTNQRAKPRDRLTAADMTLKVHGSYAPEKKMNVNFNADVKDFDAFTELSAEYDEKMKRKLIE